MKTKWLPLAACAALVAGYVIYANLPEKAAPPPPPQVKPEQAKVIKAEVRFVIAATWLDVDTYKGDVGRTFELTANAGGLVVGKAEPLNATYKSTDTIRPQWMVKVVDSGTNPQGVIICLFDNEPDTQGIRTITGTLMGNIETKVVEGRKFVSLTFYNCK